MEDFAPKWVFRLLSYISVFTLGLYAASAKNGQSIELYRWLMTSGFGLMFYFLSLPKKDGN